MITTEWNNVVIKDLTEDENAIYDKEFFENRLNDKFECMKLNEEGKPDTLWFVNHVVQVMFYEVLWGDISMVIVERNPVE